MGRVNGTIEIENARIGFRNFVGAAGRFNGPGKRNFCVFLDSPIAETLLSDGWNIKYLTPKDEEDEPIPYLQVSVSYDHIAPKIMLITKSGKTLLDESSIPLLDWAEIKTVDLVIRPYNWEVQGKVGVKGYVKSMYVTIVEDNFAAKYHDVPDSAATAMVT